MFLRLFWFFGLLLLTLVIALEALSAPACSKIFSTFPNLSVNQRLIGRQSLAKGGLSRIKNHFPGIWGIGRRPKQEIDFEGSELANTFVEIARVRRLLNQSDSRLNNMGLMVRGGGLCGPTCASNIFMSVVIHNGIHYRGQKLENPKDIPKNLDVKLVEKIIDWYNESQINHYSQSTNKILEAWLLKEIEPRLFDPKFGVLPEFFVDAIKDSYQKMDTRLIENLSIQANNLERYTNQGLLLGTVEVSRVSDGLRPEVDALHAIVVLKVDTAKKEITVSDPNTPNHIWTTRYAATGRSSIIFRSPNSYFKGDSPTVFELIDAFAIVPKNYQENAGNVLVESTGNISSGYREPVVEAGVYREPVVE